MGGLLSYTLVSDGPSDSILRHPIDWVLQCLHQREPDGQHADLARLPQPPRALAARCQRAVELYPCELLLVHRDAEDEAPERRVEEIKAALLQAGLAPLPAVCVVPVRMTEAWFLFDEAAIRMAAGNPSGQEPLALPEMNRVEGIDAKKILHAALRQACGLTGRRLKKFSEPRAVRRLAERIDDFAPLQRLPAFQRFEQDLAAALAR